MSYTVINDDFFDRRKDEWKGVIRLFLKNKSQCVFFRIIFFLFLNENPDVEYAKNEEQLEHYYCYYRFENVSKWENLKNFVLSNFKGFVIVDDDTNLTLCLSLYKSDPDTRTYIGDLVYQAKYRGDQEAFNKIFAILERTIVGEFFKFVDYISFVPSSKNLALVLAKYMSYKTKKELVPRLITINSVIQTKNIKDPVQRLEAVERKYNIQKVIPETTYRLLIIDDNYQSGTTINTIANKIKWLYNNKIEVYCFCLTKTIRNKTT